jgi:hypothetical protein
VTPDGDEVRGLGQSLAATVVFGLPALGSPIVTGAAPRAELAFTP